MLIPNTHGTKPTGKDKGTHSQKRKWRWLSQTLLGNDATRTQILCRIGLRAEPSRPLGMGGSTEDLAQDLRGANLSSANVDLVLTETRRLTPSG